MLLVLAALLAAGHRAVLPSCDGGGVEAPVAFVAEPPATEARASEANDSPASDTRDAPGRADDVEPAAVEEQAPPDATSETEPDSDASAERAPQAAEFSLSAAAGTRGERRAEAIARASGSGHALTLGAIDFGGPSAPERQEILLGAQAGPVRGELRLVPSSAGLFRAGAELGFHFETVGLILGARTASLGRAQLRGAGARIELEAALAESVHGGLSASVWALELDAPSMRHAWLTWGTSTLDWAQRWDAGAWVSLDFGELFAVTPSLSIAQPAQENTFEARGSLALEVPLGAVKLRFESALAHQWPEMWLADLSLGVAMSVY